MLQQITGKRELYEWEKGYRNTTRLYILSPLNLSLTLKRRVLRHWLDAQAFRLSTWFLGLVRGTPVLEGFFLPHHYLPLFCVSLFHKQLVLPISLFHLREYLHCRHILISGENAVFSPFSLDKCLILVFLDSKTVHSPAFNSVPWFNILLPGCCQC